MPFEGSILTEGELTRGSLAANATVSHEELPLNPKGDVKAQGERRRERLRSEKQELEQRLFEDEYFRNKQLDKWLKNVSFDNTVVHPESGEAVPVFDFGEFQQVFSRNGESQRIHTKAGSVTVSKDLFFRLIQGRYGNREYVTPEQVSAGDFETKKLFFWPESYEEVVDELELKKARFHKLPSEMSKGIDRNSPRELVDENEESQKVSILESEFALKLFHPDYGDGFRDRKGNFIIRNKQSREYEKLTYKHLEGYGFTAKIFNSEERGKTNRSIWDGMKERLPNLYREGVIQDGDIAEMSTRVQDGFKSFTREAINSRAGNVSLNDIRYTLGKSYSPVERPGLKFQNISTDNAVILDEEGNVEGYFNLYKIGDPEVKLGSNNDVKRKDITITSLDYSSIIPQRKEDESEQEFDGRVDSTKRGIAQLYTKIIPGIEGADDILTRSDSTEQKSLSEVTYWLEKNDKTDDLKVFVQEFGATGLRTFINLGIEEEFGDKIITYSLHNEETAKKVFSIYSNRLDKVNELEKTVQENFNCEENDCAELMTAVRERALGETQTFLRSAVENNDKDILDGLTRLSRDYWLLSLAIQAGVESGDIKSVEDMRSFRNDVIRDVEQSDDVLRERLLEIYRQNYIDYGYDEEAIEHLLQAAGKQLSDPNSVLYVRRIGEENVLAFSLATENVEEKTVYVGGLNSNPELKNTRSGLSTLDQIMSDYKEQGWVITGEASPKNFRGYGELPHDLVAVNASPDELGEEAYMMDIASYPDAYFKSKAMSRREVVQTAIKANGTQYEKDGVVIWQSSDPSATPPQLKEGYVATRSFEVKNDRRERVYIFVLEKLADAKHNAKELQMQNAA